jgi:integrase
VSNRVQPDPALYGGPREHDGNADLGSWHSSPLPASELLADTAPDGRLFRGLHGGPLSESVYDRWWKLARERALTPAQVTSPLARRPYDLRHAAASLWLNAGVPATEVARRLGHRVAVLLRVYANCIDGGEDGVNDRIGDALGDRWR